MAQTLTEQVDTTERALGERMIMHALVVVRAWLGELGENNPYEEAFTRIQKEYQALFAEWLSIDRDGADEALNKMTGDAYQLVDAVYADIRLKRGLSPEMHGFNQDNPQSVLQYFSSCIRLCPEDLVWLHRVMEDERRVGTALLAVTALTRNLRECFSIDAFNALIEGMAADNEVLSNLCIFCVLTLLIHYDVRIDFFPQVQTSFVNVVDGMGDAGEHVFEVLCTLVELSKKSYLEDYASGMMPLSWLPPALQKLVETSGIKDDYKTFYAWVPKSETDYMKTLVENLPNTWLYEVLVSGNPGREKMLTYTCVRTGYREMLWLHPEVAEQAYCHLLREGDAQPMDYINYAHCLLLKGDRIMAYETYLQARQLCPSAKDFYALFRPDRRQLIDHGVPMEQVYLIEDQLLVV